MKTTYFSHLTATAGGEELPITQLLKGIKDGRWLAAVGAVRAAETKAARTAAKKALPYFTVSGTFAHRKDSGLLQHSGLVALDIDAERNQGLRLDTDRRRVEADEYTFACFISAGGKGLCAIVRIPTEDHNGSFRALERYYREELGLVVDSLPDVSRPRFVSYDPKLYLNEGADVFDEVLSAPEPAARVEAVAPRPATDWQARGRGEGYGQIALRRACEKVATAPDGQKHVTLNKMAYLCGGYVAGGFLSDCEAREALRSSISGRAIEDEKGAFKTIEDGLTAGQLKPVLPDALQYQVRAQLRSGTPAADVAAVLAAAQGLPVDKLTAAVVGVQEERSREVQLLTFWNVEDPGKDKPLKLALSVDRFGAWLSAAGFYKYADAQPAGLVHVAGQIVRAVQVTDLIEHLKMYLDELPFEFDGIYLSQLREAVKRQHRMLFDPQSLLFLDPLPGTFLRDTATVHYSFYQNCWVEATAAGRTARPYEELPGLIWEHQRLSRPFTHLPDFETGTADVAQFLDYLTAEDAQRLDQMRRALGYLIHNYKDETDARAVVLMDEIGEVGRSSGGTGKGLLMKCVAAMVRLSTIGSATFDFRSPFRYELMDEGAQVLFLDEWKPQRNSFDLLFADITNGFAINRKYQAQKTIPFEQAPKFVLASNDIITGDDDSSERRKVEIALAKRYSSKHTPKDDFGRGFFSQGWDADEWVRFDNVALGWVQHWLACGRQHLLLKNASIAARGVVQTVGVGFHEFAQDLLDNARAALAEGTGDGRIWAADAFLAYQTATGDKRTTAAGFGSKMRELGLERNKCRERGPRRDQWYFFLAP